MTRAVRLTRDKFEGKTLTAITVAAHECGHAYQHAAVEPMFMLRTRLASISVRFPLPPNVLGPSCYSRRHSPCW
jgi:Zn-dependent membrane protease YugP